MTDFRALCAELLAALESWSPNGGAPLEEGAEAIAEAHLINRARTALAESQPEGPTDQELAKTAMQAVENYRFATELPYFLSEDSSEYEPLMLILRAVLARWGNHPGSPDGSRPPVATLIAAVEAIQADPDDCKDYENDYRNGWIDACNQVLELLHRRRTGALSPCSELGQ